MANKKNVEINKKSAEIENKKSNELKQKKTKQKKKLRLHSHLKVNIPLFQSLMMILPSLAKHTAAEVVDKPSNETELAKTHNVSEKDVTDDHEKENSTELTHQELQASENHAGSTQNGNQLPHGSNTHLVPSHHLSTISHPQIHYIPSVSLPTISSAGSSQPTPSSTPPASALPVTFVPEVIKGTYGELHVDVNGHYTFVLNPNSPQYVLLNQHQIGTDHFALHLSNGSSIIVQIPIAGKQDTPSISGDLAGVVTEDHNIDSQGLLHANGKIDVIDPDQNESSVKPEVISGKYGSLTIDADGHWQYQVDNSLSNVQALTAATSLHESFTIHTKDGTPQTIDMTIGGNDDNAVIIGVDAGTVTEALATQAQGQLSVTDSDLGEDHFQASQINGHFGTLTIAKDGAWTYDLDNTNPTVHALGKGATATDTITVHSADGTPHQITITVNGTNNAAIITDTQTNLNARGVTEDRGYIDTHYQLHYDGKLNIQDPDTGEAQFDPNIGPQTYQGIGYDTKLGGHILLMRDGHYTYTLDNRNIQNLAAGETQKDSAVIRSADGTTHTIELTVHGTNDKPTIAAQSHTVIEGGTLLHGQMVGQDIDTRAQLHYSAPQIDGLTLNTDGSYSFDPSNASYQSLASGATKTLTIPVTVTDEHNASATQTLSITITGVNNSAVIGGVDTADINEGSAGQDMSPDYAQPGMAHLGKSPIYASGALTIADLDSGEATFDTKGIGYNYSGKYGDLLLQENGSWSYYADAGSVRGKGGYATNRGTEIDKLGEGDTVTDTITVFSKDGTSHDIVITIHGSNDRPYCASEVQLNSGKEDSAQTITTNELLANTVDVDANDAGKLTITNLHADHGSIQDNHDGTDTFTPTKDYNGDVHFTYDVKDAHGGITRTGATTSLAAVNDNPDVTPITDSVTEDTDAHHSVNLLGTATDVDGDPLTISQVQVTFEGHTGPLPVGVGFAPDGHTLIIDSHSSAFQHLSAGQQSNITVHYMVNDNHGGQTPATATITMVGSDDKAQLQSSAIDMTEGQALHTYYTMTHMNGQIGLVDPDTNDQTQFIFSHNQGGKGFGELTIWPGGSYSYSLDWARNHHANDRVAALKQGETLTDQYQVHTSDGQSKLITVTIHGEDSNARIDVQMPNVLPATQDIYEEHFVPASQTHLYAGGILKVIDPDHDDAYLQPETVNTAHHGQFKIEAGGGWSYKIDNSLGEVQNLGAGESFTETHTVHSKDGTASQLLTVTVHGTNDAPTVSSEVKLAPGVEDTDIQLTTLELLSHATDIDHNDTGHLSVANLVADHGVIIDNKDGTFTFQPEKNYNGQVHFTYDVKDAHSGVTHTGANMVLTPTGDAAHFSGTDTGSLTEDKHVQGDAQHTIFTTGVLDVVDPDAGEDHFRATQNAHALHDPYGGTLTIGKAGDWSYSVPNGNVQHLRQGDTDQVSYEVQSAGGDKHIITLTIHGTNDTPTVSSAVTLAVGKEDTDVILQASDLLTHASDVDHGAQLSIHNLSADHGQITDNHDGTFSFTPDKDYNGPVQFNYQVQDEHGASVTQTASMDLSAVSDVALITGSGSTLKEDVNLGIAPGNKGMLQAYGRLIVVDPDGPTESGFEDPLTAGSYKGSLGGSLQVNPDGQYMYNLGNFRVDYLKKGEVAHDRFTVHSLDGTTHTLEFEIQGTNDAPYIRGNLHHAVWEDEAVLHGQLNGADADAGDQQHLVYATTAHVAGFHLNADGSYTFDPSDAAYQHLTGRDIWGSAIKIPVTVTDQDGLSTTQSLSISVMGRNDAPVVSADVRLASGTEDTAVTIRASALLTNATDADDYEARNLSISGLRADHGSITDNQDGTYTFTPDPDYNGQVQLSYAVEDRNGASTPAHATLDLVPVDDKTQFTGVDQGVATEDIATHMSTNVNIMDAVDWQALKIADVDNPNTQVTVKFAGQHYTWYLGSDLDVMTPYGKFQFHTITNGPHTGEHSWSYIGNNNNVHVQELKHGESLTESIKLIATDGTEFPITVKVNGTEDGVIIDSKSELGHVVENAQTGASVSGSVIAHDVDLHDTVSWTQTPTAGLNGQYGTFHLSADGQWHYDVDQNKATKLGDSDEYWEHFTVEAVSTDGSHVSRSVSVVVHGNNDAPTVSGEVTLPSGKEDTSIHITQAQLVANAIDVDSNDRGWLHVQNLTADHGSLVSNSDGSFTFNPDPNYNGTVHFTYDIADRHGGIAHTGANTSLVAVNDAATFTGDSGNIEEDTNIHHNVRTTGSATIADALVCHGHLIISDADGHGEAALDLNGQQKISQDGTYGHFDVTSRGTWIYIADNKSTPIQDLDNGQTLTDSIEITSKDGTKHSITVTISGTTDSPLLHSLSDSGIQHSGPIEGNLITGSGTHEGLSGAATDTDSNAHLVLQDIQINDPVSGYVTVTPGQPHTMAGIGTLAIEANGHYTFTPDAGFTGKVPSMVYRVGDDGGNPIRDSSQNSLSIEVTPPVQHDEPDPPLMFEASVTIVDDSNAPNEQQVSTTDPQHHDVSHHGVATYLDALGIKPDATSTTVHDQPADIDIVLAQVDQQDATTHDHAHLDMSDALEHHDASTNHNQDDEHHHHNDVDELPDIDPNN